MKRLSDLLEYIKNKRFVRRYESNSENYEGGILLANSDYCDASVDVILFKN